MFWLKKWKSLSHIDPKFEGLSAEVKILILPREHFSVADTLKISEKPKIEDE